MPKNEKVCEEQIDILADRIAKNLREMGLLEGGIPGSGPGKKTGRKALTNIARRGLVGLRKIKPSRNSEEITIYDTSPIDKNYEYLLAAQLIGDFGGQIIQNHLVLTELLTTEGELADLANYFQFVAPRAGRILRVKLLAQIVSGGSTTADLHVYSRNPQNFNYATEERYNLVDVTGIDLAGVSATDYTSVYDAVHVDSYYIVDELGSDSAPLEQLWCNIVASSGVYNFILRMWIEPMGW